MGATNGKPGVADTPDALAAPGAALASPESSTHSSEPSIPVKAEKVDWVTALGGAFQSAVAEEEARIARETAIEAETPDSAAPSAAPASPGSPSTTRGNSSSPPKTEAEDKGFSQEDPRAITREPPSDNVLASALAKLHEGEKGRTFTQWKHSDIKFATWLACTWIYDPENTALPEGARVLKSVEESPSRSAPCAAVVFAPPGADDATYFIVWRGSQSFFDALVDAAAVPTPLKDPNVSSDRAHLGIEMHSGVFSAEQQDVLAHSTLFRERMKQIEELKARPTAGAGTDEPEMSEVDTALRRVKRVVFTGHSLGGSVAMATMLQLLRVNAKPTRLSDFQPVEMPAEVSVSAVAFGAPQPFVVSESPPPSPAVDEILMDFRRSTINFVYGNDLVPRLPAGLAYLERHKHHLVTSSLSSSLGLPRFLASMLSSIGPSNMLGEFLTRARETGSSLERYEHRCINIWLTRERDGDGGMQMQVKITNRRELLDPARRIEDGPSILGDHMKYHEGVFAAFQRQDIFGIDELACIAYVDPFYVHDWVGSRIVHFNKWTLHSAKEQLDHRMRLLNLDDSAQGQTCAHVIAFNGDSGSGKSTIIHELQSLDGEDININRLRPSVNRKPTERRPSNERAGSQSTDCNLYDCFFTFGGSTVDDPPREELVWLMDCEGTNGTERPRTLGEYRPFLPEGPDLNDGHRRSTAIKKFLPPFALLASDIFCYVSLNQNQNTIDARSVKEYVQQGFQHVQNKSPCALVIFKQRGDLNDAVQEDGEILHYDKSYEAFELRVFYQTQDFVASNTVDVEAIKSCGFAEVLVLSFPLKPQRKQEGFVQRDGSFISKLDIYKQELMHIKHFLKTRLEVQVKAKQQDSAWLSKLDWLGMVDDIVTELGRGNYLSMAKLFVTMRHKGKSFSDVVELFSERLTPACLMPDTAAELTKYIATCWKDAIAHAARIIIARQGAQVSVLTTLEKETLHPSLMECATSMSNLVPCCSEHQGKVCGQPRVNHFYGHKTIHKTGWFFKKDEKWLGDFVQPPDWSSRLDDFPNAVIAVADELLVKLHLHAPPLRLNRSMTSPRVLGEDLPPRSMDDSMDAADDQGGMAAPLSADEHSAASLRKIMTTSDFSHLAENFQNSAECRRLNSCFVCADKLPTTKSNEAFFRYVSWTLERIIDTNSYGQVDVCKACLESHAPASTVLGSGVDVSDLPGVLLW